jgi:hypothetical protein
MEKIIYTVKAISGDYAVLVSESGEENRMALALLPYDIDEGDRVIYEDYSYRKK